MSLFSGFVKCHLLALRSCEDTGSVMDWSMLCLYERMAETKLLEVSAYLESAHHLVGVFHL